MRVGSSRNILRTLCYLMITICESQGLNWQRTAMQNLTLELLSGYDGNVRPVRGVAKGGGEGEGGGGAMRIGHWLLLKQLISVDSKTQTVKLFLHEHTTWRDHYLQWDPLAHHNITHISLARQPLWIPDIIVFNQVSSVPLLSPRM